MIRKVTDLNNIVWQERQRKEKPDLKPVGNDWVMDTMPFNAFLKEDLQKDKPLQYLCEGKYISFKPIGGTLSKGKLREDKRSVGYKDGLGTGVSIDVEVSQTHWKELIKIDFLDDVNAEDEFVEFKFLVESDFDIPERENIKPRIKLGENSYIEVGQAWDSKPVVIDEDGSSVEPAENRIPVRSFFKRKQGELYFIKQIPSKWLKQAVFPVWADADIVYGSAQEFGDINHDCRNCQCCEIDTNKFVVVWKDSDDGNAGDARVGTVSGTTITWGAISEFYSDVNVGVQLGVCKLATNKFVVVYSGSGADGYARAATVSTRTITWGTAKEFETGDTTYPSCCQLGTDKFAITYNDVGAGNLGTVCICTVATRTITSGTPVAFEGNISDNRCCKLGTDKFVAFYRDAGDSNYGKACAFSVSNTTPTAGPILTIDANTTTDQDCCQLDTDKCVIAWRDATNSKGKVEILTRDDDPATDTLHEGAEVEFDVGATSNIGLAKMDATHFIITYEDVGNSEKGTSRYCSFSGTTVSLDGEELFNDAKTHSTDVCLISTDKVAVVYRDDADANDIGEAIIGDVPGVPSPPTNVAATDGAHTDKVVVTWTKSAGATNYKVFENGNDISGELGDVDTYDDTAAGAGTISNAGTATAEDGATDDVTLSLANEATANGASRTYKVQAKNAVGWSGDSNTDTGYRTVGSITYQWQISAADSDADYGNISGATTDPYNHEITHTDGRYYKCICSSVGASNSPTTSSVDRGWRKHLPVTDGDLIGIPIIRKS